MKLVVINGSRSPEGQTATATASLIAGAQAAGSETEQFFLPTMNIERCRQCDDSGWGLCRREGRCVIEDDLDSLLCRIREADVVVFATPVYFGELSESLRAFMDRMRRVVAHGGGQGQVRGKPAVGVCVAGGSGGGATRCAFSLEIAMMTTGFAIVDMVPAKRQNLAEKREALHTIGEWLATKPSSQ